MVPPGTGQIFAIRVEQFDRFRPQLKGAPVDDQLTVRCRQFRQGRLRQPTKRSKVIGKDL
jgi:hypothetical protein